MGLLTLKIYPPDFTYQIYMYFYAEGSDYLLTHLLNTVFIDFQKAARASLLQLSRK